MSDSVGGMEMPQQQITLQRRRAATKQTRRTHDHVDGCSDTRQDALQYQRQRNQKNHNQRERRCCFASQGGTQGAGLGLSQVASEEHARHPPSDATAPTPRIKDSEPPCPVGTEVLTDAMPGTLTYAPSPC
eukprot:564356-Rhodomonas_salina.1